MDSISLHELVLGPQLHLRMLIKIPVPWAAAGYHWTETLTVTWADDGAAVLLSLVRRPGGSLMPEDDLFGDEEAEVHVSVR